MFIKKKDRTSVSILNAAEDQQADDLSANDSATNWWGGLSRNSKWLVFGITAFLSIGGFGAGLKYLEEDARKQNKIGSKDHSMLSRINPFATALLPSSTPQLSKEYIYAGSRLLAVEDANANAAPPADLAVWRPSTGVWYVLDGVTGQARTTANWGQSGDVPVPGDYDGDGKTDFSVFRPGNNQWYIVYSSNDGISNYEFGATGDKPAQADYDGDGKTDAAVYRPSTYVWYVQGSSAGYYTVTWGAVGDTPASADYDGDGKADLAVWRSSNSTFYSINSTNQSQNTVTIGQSGEPVSADYDGDGKADYALFNASNANWHIRQSTTVTVVTTSWGSAADRPVQNDYDGDGKVDLATWRDSNGYWFIRQSAYGNSLRNVGWGQSGDIPVPAFYRR